MAQGNSSSKRRPTRSGGKSSLVTPAEDCTWRWSPLPTSDGLRDLFEYYNQLYFGGELKTLVRYGTSFMRCVGGETLFNTRNASVEVVISPVIHQPLDESELVNTLLHAKCRIAVGLKSGIDAGISHDEDFLEYIDDLSDLGDGEHAINCCSHKSDHDLVSSFRKYCSRCKTCGHERYYYDRHLCFHNCIGKPDLEVVKLTPRGCPRDDPLN